MPACPCNISNFECNQFEALSPGGAVILLRGAYPDAWDDIDLARRVPLRVYPARRDIRPPSDGHFDLGP
jgi:hypothetical protein